MAFLFRLPGEAGPLGTGPRPFTAIDGTPYELRNTLQQSPLTLLCGGNSLFSFSYLGDIVSDASDVDNAPLIILDGEIGVPESPDSAVGGASNAILKSDAFTVAYTGEIVGGPLPVFRHDQLQPSNQVVAA